MYEMLGQSYQYRHYEYEELIKYLQISVEETNRYSKVPVVISSHVTNGSSHMLDCKKLKELGTQYPYRQHCL